MRTSEIFFAIAAILVFVIMRSKAESFWPFSSYTPGSKVAGRPGMVYGKRSGLASKSAYLKKIDVAEKLLWKKMILDGRAMAPKVRATKKTLLNQHNSRAFDPSYFAVATPQGAKKQSRKSYNRMWS